MKVLKNAFWLTGARVAGDLSSFALFVALSRSFGPATTGEYSYSFALASFVAFLGCAGFDEYGTALYVRAASAAERRSLWADIVSAQYAQLALAVLCFAVFLLLTGGARARASVILELAALLTGQYLARTYFIPAMASQAMKAPALIDLGCRFSAIAFGLVAIVASTTSLPEILIGFPIAGVLFIVLAARTAVVRGASLKPHFDVRRIGRTLRASVTFTGCELLGQFYSRTDFLLIAFLLGTADVGLYAADMKFVEYAILPLYLLGLAAYPALSRAAAFDPPAFRESVRELARLMFFIAGWVAVGLFCVVPLVLTPILGEKFAAAVAILPWFAALAMLKGGEGTIYRVVYAVRRPWVYFAAMLAGTALTIALNFALIPRLGLVGAIIAAIASVALVIGLCAARLRRSLTLTTLFGAVARLAGSLALTGAVLVAAQHVAAPPWAVALAACGSYPLFGLLCGLLPHPARSRLLHPQTAENVL